MASINVWDSRIHTTVVVNGLKLFRQVFQRWMLSERQEEVLELGRIDSNLSLTALSSLVFFRTLDSPTTLTSSTTVSDTTSSEYSSHARSSGCCIPLMRSAEHFRKASDAALTPATEFRAVAILLKKVHRPNGASGG